MNVRSGSGGIVGIIANPAAGKDIRRLVSSASPTSDMAKIGIVRRALVGAIEGGAERILIGDDHKSLGRQAMHALDERFVEAVEIVDADTIPSSIHTRLMAARMADRGVGALVVLGGDGTHRDVVKGWRHAPLVPVSTGTNNVFPRMVEATVAGHAAAIAATGARPLDELGHRAKVLDVVGEHHGDDLALIDLALVDGMFTASRAVWDTSAIRRLIATTAEPDSIGLSSIAARLMPTDRRASTGVAVAFGPGHTVRAPIAPGLYQDIDVAAVEPVTVASPLRLDGPGVVAFDGERDMVLDAGQSVDVTLAHDGPWVIEPALAMTE